MTEKAIELDDAQSYLGKIIVSLNAMDRREKGPLVAVLEQLSHYIQSTQRDIAELHTGHDGGNSFSTAAIELDEVSAEVSKATNEIMGAAEAIEQLSATLDKETAVKLSDIVTRIYEACAFQDITGQRISKVVKTIQKIEENAVGLARACGKAIEMQGVDTREGDSKLLNGPQATTNKKSQDEIDKLFESMG